MEGPRPGVNPGRTSGHTEVGTLSRAHEAPEDAALQRRLSARRARHESRINLQAMVRDGDAIDDAVLPTVRHDIGRKASPKAPKPPQPGRRRGFKVWKTPFWKRRRQLWADRNAAERQVAAEPEE
jgi:hypothetical protein